MTAAPLRQAEEDAGFLRKLEGLLSSSAAARGEGEDDFAVAAAAGAEEEEMIGGACSWWGGGVCLLRGPLMRLMINNKTNPHTRIKFTYYIT